MEQTDLVDCAGCKKTFHKSSTQKCAICEKVRYCSAACQRIDRTRHNENCTAIIECKESKKILPNKTESQQFSPKWILKRQDEANTAKITEQKTGEKTMEKTKDKQQQQNTKEKAIQGQRRIPPGSLAICWDPIEGVIPDELRPAFMESNAEKLFMGAQYGARPTTIFEASNLILHQLNTQKYYPEECTKFAQSKNEFVEKIKKEELYKISFEKRMEYYIDSLLQDYAYIGEEEKQQIRKFVTKIKINPATVNTDDVAKAFSLALSEPFFKMRGKEKHDDYIQSILYILLNRMSLSWDIVWNNVK